MYEELIDAFCDQSEKELLEASGSLLNEDQAWDFICECQEALTKHFNAK